MIPTTKQKAPAPALATREPGKLDRAMPYQPTTGIVSKYPLSVKVNLDSVAYSHKPTSDYAAIRIRMGNSTATQTIDAGLLFHLILRGHTFTPAAMSGTNGNSWKEQAVFAVDIDNENMSPPLTVERAREIMREAGIVPLFGYHTFSHTENVPRFRLVFASDEAVTDKATAEHITEGLQSLFPGVDKSGKDAARMFLGTNKGAAIEYTGQTNPVSRLLDLYHAQVEPEQTTVTTASHPVGDSALARAIEEFDMGGYVSMSEGLQGKWRSGRLMFNPCPICGHKDDFYTQGNVWKCFGANCPVPDSGGNIINYLEAKHGFTREQARDYFMYDILKWDRAEAQERYRESQRKQRAERATGAAAITDKDKRPEYILVKKKRDPATGETVEVESVSCPRLSQYIREHEHYKFVKIPGAKSPVRFWYRGGVYNEVYEDEIMGAVIDLIDAWNPDIMRQSDVEEVYKTIKRKPGDNAWVDVNDKDAEELVVNCKNGLYYPMTNELKPHTPDLFTTRQLPIEFPLDALEMDNKTLLSKCPTFAKFMARFCRGAKRNHPDGDRRYLCLLEWMSLILSNVNGRRIKKSMWFHGKGDSGKSQLLELIHYLLGVNAHNAGLEKLEERFGLGAIFNKRLVYCPDQKYINVKELGVFKQIVGVDSLNLERKGRDAFTYDYDGFLWLCMNRLPKFGGDDGKHVYKRMILFKTPEPVPEAEQDGDLLNKMKAEAPYIVAFIMRYLLNVVKRGYKITEPLETEKAREMYAFENDPVRQWLAECCIKVDSPADDEESDTVAEWRNKWEKPLGQSLYTVYCEWCNKYENGHKLKWNDWKHKLKEILGDSDMLDMPDPEQPDRPALFFKRFRYGMVIAHYCLNAAAASEYSNWI